MFFRRIILLALPARYFAEKYLALFLMLAAAGTMLVAQSYNEKISSLRSSALSGFAPVLSVMTQPVRGVRAAFENMQDIAAVRAQNEQLRTENQKLQDWYNNALRLQSENRSLKDLLNMKQDAELNYITARVIADAGSSYVHSVVVEIPGKESASVRRGMAVLSGQGLVGRVIDLDSAHRYARILLVTDMSSRIPVLMENSRQRAVAAGDNSGLLYLDHVPDQTPLEDGERVITSGYDGMFPAGLPVGRIVKADARNGNGPTLQPLSDLDRLDIVRLVDYGTIDSSIAVKSAAATAAQGKAGALAVAPVFPQGKKQKTKSR